MNTTYYSVYLKDLPIAFEGACGMYEAPEQKSFDDGLGGELLFFLFSDMDLSSLLSSLSFAVLSSLDSDSKIK